MKNRKPQLFMVFGMLLAVLILFGLPAVVLAADAYPSKPVRIIVPQGPGAAHEIIARIIATRLSERLGKQVIVECHGGGGGIIGMEL
ncbi:MAG: tripartite tricarboxylate transporter substrate binding protein, partial [Candidatus Omnitrophota bacterium]